MKQHIVILLFTLLPISTLFGVSTSFFVEDSIKDFEKGRFSGVSVNENGQLFLGPSRNVVLNKHDLFVWDIVRNRRGEIFIATGLEGRLYRLNKQGRPELFHKAEAMSVQALTVGKDDTLYAATSPQGRILAFNREGKAREVARFQETYLWDMAVAPDGGLYLVTGNPARLYRVDPGTGRKTMLFADKGENHFLCLAVSKAGSIYFGSEGNGLLYKREASGRTRVMFDTYEDEIACLLLDGKGQVYFGTGTERKRITGNAFRYKDSLDFFEDPAERKKKNKQENTGKNKKKTTSKKKRSLMRNSVYRLTVHDKVEKVFTMSKASFYALALDKQGNLLVGSGDFGVVYRITPAGMASRLVRLRESQVLSFLVHDDTLYAGSGNDGKLFRLGFRSKRKGEFVSQVFDCHTTVTWGSLSWEGETPPATGVQIYTRTGNSDTPDQNWSAWMGPLTRKKGDPIRSPSARYLQYKVVLHSTELGKTPLVQTVRIPFLKQNRAPRIRNIILTSYADASKKQKQKMKPGQCSVAWFAADDDGDTLKYAVYFRIGEDPHWRLLKDDITSNSITFHTSILPDGYYRFRVVASDILSNTEDTQQTGMKDSRKFLVDNTGPSFQGFKAQTEGDVIIITGYVRDNISNIGMLRYTINARRWRFSHPADRVFDSQEEKIRIKIDRRNNPDLFSGLNMIIIRAADDAENWSTTKLFFPVRLQRTDLSIQNNARYFRMMEKHKQ